MALFSKRHYEFLANELKAINTIAKDGEAKGTVAFTISRIADALARDNPRFNAEKFHEATRIRSLRVTMPGKF